MGDRKLMLPPPPKPRLASVSGRLRELRKAAGLSQRVWARRIGTTASAICRLEDEEYDRHSLDMLRRIAAAFGMLVEVQFIPDESRDPAGGSTVSPSGAARGEETEEE